MTGATTALFIAIAFFVVGIVVGIIAVIGWSVTRTTVSRNRQKSEKTIEALIGRDQAADLLDVESSGDVRVTEAMASLIESLADTERAVVQVGDILLIKDSDRVLTRLLTPRQLRYLERHPDLLKSPSDILRALDDPTNPLGRPSAVS